MGSTKSKARRTTKSTLRVHSGSGQWCKKIRGHVRYFGSQKSDPQGLEALKRYADERQFWEKGQTPPSRLESAHPAANEALTVKELTRLFLLRQEEKLKEGMSPRTYRDYFRECKALTAVFGKGTVVKELGPADFSRYRRSMIAETADKKKLGPVTIKNRINLTRIVFNWGVTKKLISEVDFGDEFVKPKAAAIRRDRLDAGAKLFTPDEVRRLIDAAGDQLRAMILLGINTAFGNTDLAELPQSAVDLDAGFVNFAREKTAIPRRCPLWPVTVQAIRVALIERPKPAAPEYDNRIFLTRAGMPWTRTQPKKKIDGAQQFAGTQPHVLINSLTQAFGKLLERLRINGRRQLGFYTLRHTHRTWSGGAKDPEAANAIMGHLPPGMAAVYVQGHEDERLKAVVEVVRKKIWPDT